MQINRKMSKNVVTAFRENLQIGREILSVELCFSSFVWEGGPWTFCNSRVLEVEKSWLEYVTSNVTC